MDMVKLRSRAVGEESRAVEFDGEILAVAPPLTGPSGLRDSETLCLAGDRRLVVYVTKSDGTATLVEVSEYELKTGTRFKALAREAGYLHKPLDLDEALEHCKGVE